MRKKINKEEVKPKDTRVLATEFEIKVKAYWKHQPGRFTDSEDLYFGKVKVASVYFDATIKGQENMQKVRCSMDGMKDDFGHFKTTEEAKAKAEQVLRHWVYKLLAEQE